MSNLISCNFPRDNLGKHADFIFLFASRTIVDAFDDHYLSTILMSDFGVVI